MKDLVLHFVTQLVLIQLVGIRGGRMYSHGLLDIVHGNYEVKPNIRTL